MDVRKLEAGRKLDALVAEEVIGLDVLGELAVIPSVDCCSGYDIPYNQPLYDLEQSRQGWAVRPIYLRDCACPAGERQPGDDDYWGHYAACLEVVLPFSANNNAMQDVIDAMRKRDFWWSASYKTACYVDDLNRPGYEVTFRCVYGGTRGTHTAAAHTLAHATAIAALLAVMGDES